MAPEPIDLEGRFDSEEAEEEMREKLEQRFERIGNKILHRTDPGQGAAALVGAMTDRFKRAMAAQIIGQAYFRAYNAMRQNREALEKIADVLVERRELHGDEVVDLLDQVAPKKASVDVLDKACWPKL